MKALVDEVMTESPDPDDFSWIGIRFLPETEEDIRMIATIAENHRQLAKEESEESVAVITSFWSSPNPKEGISLISTSGTR